MDDELFQHWAEEVYNVATIKAGTHGATLRATRQLHRVSTSAIVARNVAGNAARVRASSTSATLPPTVSPCSRFLQYCVYYRNTVLCSCGETWWPMLRVMLQRVSTPLKIDCMQYCAQCCIVCLDLKNTFLCVPTFVRHFAAVTAEWTGTSACQSESQTRATPPQAPLNRSQDGGEMHQETSYCKCGRFRLLGREK